MIFNSIRWRLQAWHGLILVLVLGGFGFTACHVARDNQLRHIDHDLELQLMALFRPQSPSPPPAWANPTLTNSSRPDTNTPPEVMSGPPFGPPPGPADLTLLLRNAIERAALSAPSQSNSTSSVYYIAWKPDGSLIARSPNAPTGIPLPALPATRRAQTPTPGNRSFTPPGPPMPSVARTRGEFRELSRLLPRGECFLAGRSMAADLAAMRRLTLWLIIAGASVLVLGLVGGWWVATRAIRPIEDISATAIKIAAGDLSQRIDAAESESELGRLTALLNSTFARLEAAFAHQARFTSDASHELRTPISVILSQTQTALSRQRPAPEYREALEACQRAAQRMRTLSESLLQLARLEAGQEPLRHDPFDLAQVARDSLDLVRPLADQRRLTLECDLPSVLCVGDPERVGQVALNLLANAIHFNRDGGQIRLTARTDASGACLQIADTGEGIPATDLPHIFERFYRVDTSRSRPHGRTGLGLAICKAIVDAHGGSIEVTSTPTVGTTFTVRLPSEH